MDVLFGALLLIVVGSMVGEWMSVMNLRGTGDAWFDFGHARCDPGEDRQRRRLTRSREG